MLPREILIKALSCYKHINLKYSWKTKITSFLINCCQRVAHITPCKETQEILSTEMPSSSCHFFQEEISNISGYETAELLCSH